jgi:thioredoxin-related protein
MKPLRFHLALLFFLLLFGSALFAQAGKLPPFQMVQANGKIFRAQDLPVGKPILLIYFSPDCDHCEKMLKAFFAQAGNFQKASVAFITFLPVAKVSKFAKDNHLVNYPNMVAGTEGSTFFIRNYYRVRDLPFVALYTKNGDYVTSFEKEVNLTMLAEKLKQLR